MKKTAIAAFVFLGVVWGSNFMFVKWAAQLISPLQITLLRVLFGFVPVLLYALATKALRREHWRHAHHFLVMSLLATAVYYFAFAKGTALLDTGIAGMLGGAIPLFTFLCAWLFLRSEQLNAIKTLGIGVGFAGILLVAKPWSAQGAINPQGIGYMIFGALSVGCSFVYAKRFVSPLGLPAAALTSYQIGLALLMLLVVTPLDGIGDVFTDTHAWVGLVIGLGLLGTGAAYLAYYFIVDAFGALAASAVTYIPPVVALLIGAWMGEPVTATSWVAAGLILAGVALVQLHARFAKPARCATLRTPSSTPN
ncbi:TPA: DMT family transporter [Pseudomonas putida]|nr:DMT family transporter [Pseudomonas putida]